MGKSIIIGIVAVVILAGGGYLIFHKSPTKTPVTTTSSSSSSAKSTAVVNNAVVITKTDSKLGNYLADPSGKTLYTYNGDKSGVSNCGSSCLLNWPVYQDKGSTSGLPSDISTIKRSDNGQIQYTYQGMPLYYFTGDSQGQVTGNGVENFTVAKPVAASSSQSTTTSPSSSSSQSSTGSPNYNY